MSKKHFEAITKSFKDCKPSGYSSDFQDAKLNQWKECVEKICETLRTFNPRFNREKFLEACDYYD